MEGAFPMLDRINSILLSQPVARVALLCFLISMLIGLIDHLTGSETALALFYLVPVSIAAWYISRRSALFLAVAAAGIWLLADYSSGRSYSHPAIYFWNATVRLGFFIITVFLISRIRQLLEIQTTLAQLDSLTGLRNARSFAQACTSVFDLSRRHGRSSALCYIDIDGFKGINDSLGHSVGDNVLRAVGCLLAKRLRASDIGARLGGDEFAILLPETTMAGARSFFTELHAGLVTLAISNQWPIGFSIGVAVFPVPPATPDDAIRQADDLMYQMKHSDTNSVLFSESASGHGHTAPLAATSDLRRGAAKTEV
jgi:diguanylate cyclase (GGDEF)-like protein